MNQETLKVYSVVALPDGRLDSANAARYLGLSPKTLAMLRCAGKGPPYVKRGRIFYYQTDLNQWLKEGRVMTTSELRAPEAS